MAKEEGSKETPKSRREAPAAPARSDNKVPEWAENMEHTLRRLVREKERERAKSPGLYR